MHKRIATIFGTRPEAIKLAPVILGLKAETRAQCHVCVTAQHRQMLDQVLPIFGIKPDVDLNLMRQNQTLSSLTARAIEAIAGYLSDNKPDLVLVQGDTTTAFCAALAAFYHHIPVGHVEAGLRTGNLDAPWPEEANRVLTTRLAQLHFAPTEIARDNLLRDGVPAAQIIVCGNTVIDALFQVKRRFDASHDMSDRMLGELKVDSEFARHFLNTDPTRKLILVTGHRRESFGTGFENICRAIRNLVETRDNVGVIYPVHLNPNVQRPVKQLLGNCPRIQLIPPLSYEPFVWLMDKAHFILSDSGGVQEEAPSLGKPVLVLRDTTERPEGVAAGTCHLVGTDIEKILKESLLLLDDPGEYQRRSRIKNPYGDGQSTPRIIQKCFEFLEKR
jgi:UDP-N-acetylglucosamine 2-epimerase (non-hydrolysing)